MLLQEKDILKDDTYFSELQIKVTLRCNMYCKHCYAASEDYPYEPAELTNFEWVERLCKNDRIKVMHIQGGEPTLAFDAMKECSRIGKKYGKQVWIFTNGKLLYEDKLYRQKFDDEVCPDILIVSYNKYLQEQTNQIAVLNALAEHYKDDPRIKLGTTAVIDNTNPAARERFYQRSLNTTDGSWPSYDPSLYPELESKLNFKCWKLELPLCDSSRARRSGVAAKDCLKRCWPNGFTGCDFDPVLVPSGFLQADCGCGDLTKTTLGFIDDFGEDPIEYIYNHKMTHTLSNPDIKISDYFEICEKYKSIRCLDCYPRRTLPAKEYTKHMNARGTHAPTK